MLQVGLLIFSEGRVRAGTAYESLAAELAR